MAREKNSDDKRSVSTDALETLGTIIDEGAGRDAIHLAVEPVIAGEDGLQPGQHIGIQDGHAFSDGVKYVGIVDPFLLRPVRIGERFWLVVFPRQITSLRHVWSHPDFPEPSERVKLTTPPTDAERAASEEWLRQYIASHDAPDYHTLIAATVEAQYAGTDYLYIRGQDAHGEIPDEVYDHIERVIGEPLENRPGWFSCSC